MSHFSVLCIGDVDHNMAPFHEFRCDGVDDEFVKDIENTDEVYKEFTYSVKCFSEVKEKYLNDLADPGKDRELTEAAFRESSAKMFTGSTFREYLDYAGIAFRKDGDPITKETKFEYAAESEDGSIKVYERTNPVSVYDWYVEGGRYSGLLLLKDGTRADHALKKDIDFAAMEKEQYDERLEKYRNVISLMGGIPRLDRTWNEYLEMCDRGEITVERAWEEYGTQEAVIKLRKSGHWIEDFDDFCCTEQECMSKIRYNIHTFGIVKDREYHSKGDCGWWGVVSNEKDEEKWSAEYQELIDSVGDDELITVLDCHI